MDTTQLRAELTAQRQAMTASANERRQQQAAARWVALGGSAAGLARVDAGHFMSLNERQQQELVKITEGK